MSAQVERVARCSGKTCHARIFWRATTSGERMPLDAEPTLETGQGVYVLDPDGIHCEPFFPMWHSYDVTRYRAHWISCPDRDAFRTKGSHA